MLSPDPPAWGADPGFLPRTLSLIWSDFHASGLSCLGFLLLSFPDPFFPFQCAKSDFCAKRFKYVFPLRLLLVVPFFFLPEHRRFFSSREVVPPPFLLMFTSSVPFPPVRTLTVPLPFGAASTPRTFRSFTSWPFSGRGRLWCRWRSLFSFFRLHTAGACTPPPALRTNFPPVKLKQGGSVPVSF